LNFLAGHTAFCTFRWFHSARTFHLFENSSLFWRLYRLGRWLFWTYLKSLVVSRELFLQELLLVNGLIYQISCLKCRSRCLFLLWFVSKLFWCSRERFHEYIFKEFSHLWARLSLFRQFKFFQSRQFQVFFFEEGHRLFEVPELIIFIVSSPKPCFLFEHEARRKGLWSYRHHISS